MINYQESDISLESQWRAIILFGKNSATYKFAFAKALLELVDEQTTRLSLSDLAVPFSKQICDHLKVSDKQGNSNSSTFLNACRAYNRDKLSYDELLHKTEKLGFVNVIDAFQNVNSEAIPDLFYQKDFSRQGKFINITDNLLRLRESFHFQNFYKEAEARWSLVETAWNLKIRSSMLEVEHDADQDLLFINDSKFMRRVDISSVRDALNGYQKGKCFYTFKDISVISQSPDFCHIDHFLPHTNKRAHFEAGANINGVWNLVLCHQEDNGNKSAKVPHERFLERLYTRNEYYIESKHPLAETIINQTGATQKARIEFLKRHHQIALNSSIQRWEPELELEASF